MNLFACEFLGKFLEAAMTATGTTLADEHPVVKEESECILILAGRTAVTKGAKLWNHFVPGSGLNEFILAEIVIAEVNDLLTVVVTDLFDSPLVRE